MITQEIQSLSPSALIELFVLDLSAIRPGAPRLTFHAGTNQLRQPVRWQGTVYEPMPIKATDFDVSSRGTLPRPRITVANPDGVISSDMVSYDDFVGAKVIRKRTFARYLDADNFPGGKNPSADPTQHFPDEEWYVEQKVQEDKTMVQFELSSPFDVAGVRLPARQMIRNSCPWQYRGGDCGYTGSAMFDHNDNPTGNRADDKCGKRLKSCRLRFEQGGNRQPLPFGGFVGAVLFD